MKTNWMKFSCMALLCFIFSGCSENKESTAFENHGYLTVFVGFTNNSGTDLIEEAPKITKENCMSFGVPEKDTWSGTPFGDGAKAVYFDVWETYMDGKLVAKGKPFAMSYSNWPDKGHDCVYKGYRCVELCGNGEAEFFLDSTTFNDPHTIEHRIVSRQFFGDDDEHILQLDFVFVYPAQFKYDIQLDGKKLDVYYPEHWTLKPSQEAGALEPTDNLGPIFFINVDEF